MDLDLLQTGLDYEIEKNGYNGIWLGIYKDEDSLLSCADPFTDIVAKNILNLATGSIPDERCLAYVHNSSMTGVVGLNCASLLDAYFCTQNWTQNVDVNK